MKCVAEVDIPYERIQALVTDSAAYCKKAYREVLSPLFPRSTHVLCLAHIVADTTIDFHHVATLITVIKSSFFKKPGRKSHFLSFLKDTISPTDVKLPPVPISTR